jgi:predicted phage terminase large subunit-like protein
MNSKQEKIKKLIEIEELVNAKCYKNFYSFFQKSWEIIEPSTKLCTNWHHELIAEYLKACYLRQIKRLIINVPPRTLKSSEITIAFPCWVWANKPSEKFLCASYNHDLSMKHADKRRSIITSDWYRQAYANFEIEKDTDKDFRNSKKGHFRSTSLLGSATGEGGNWIIIDDPHDAQKVTSDVTRKKEVDTFNTKFTTRLDDKENGVIIIVMQRLHENDLTGHLLSERKGYEHLCLPAIADKKIIIDFPISKKQIVREVGDILHAEREDATKLEEVKKDLGSFGFAGQYMQTPSPKEGGLFKKHFWQFYNQVPTDFDEIIDSWDCTFKELITSDYVAGTVWGIKGANRYLLHVTYLQMGIIKTIDAMINHRSLFPRIERTLIEDKANGTAIIEVMKEKIQGIIPINPKDSKEARAQAIIPQLESHNVFLPTPSIATFDVENYIDNLAKFPNAANDDLVDSTTQALIYAKTLRVDRVSFFAY